MTTVDDHDDAHHSRESPGTSPRRGLLRSAEHAAGCLGRCEAQQLLYIGSDGHRAQHVQEEERAVRVITAGQIAVRQTADQRQRHEGQLGYRTAVEPGYKQGAIGQL